MERLWDIVDREKITVRYADLSRAPEKIQGLYLYDNHLGPLIVLNKGLHRCHRLHKCVFSEEIGHFYTAPRTNLLKVHASANLQAMESQDERKAARWATDFLISDHDLTNALESGYHSCYELAEYFDVTEWFMYRKLGFLKMCCQRKNSKIKGLDLFDIAMQPYHIIL